MTERKASRYLTGGGTGRRSALGRRESADRPSRSKGKRRWEVEGEGWRSEETGRRRERRGVFEGSALRGFYGVKMRSGGRFLMEVSMCTARSARSRFSISSPDHKGPLEPTLVASVFSTFYGEK